MSWHKETGNGKAKARQTGKRDKTVLNILKYLVEMVHKGNVSADFYKVGGHSEIRSPQSILECNTVQCLINMMNTVYKGSMTISRAIKSLNIAA